MRINWGKPITKYQMIDPVNDGGLGDLLEHLKGGGGEKGDPDPDDKDLDPDDDDPDPEDDDPDGDPRSGEQDDLADGDDPDRKPDDDDGDDEPTDDPNLTMIADLKAQNLKLMGMLENTTKVKPDAPASDPTPDLFASPGFKKLGEVLELDDAEQGVLKSFMEQFGQHVAKNAVKDAISQTPTMIDTQINKAQQADEVKKNFYSSHPALGQVKGYVAQVANMVAKENGSLSVADVLEETAKRTYSALGIDPKKIADAAKPGKRKPAFAKAPKGGRKPAKKKSALASDMDKMLNTFK